MKDLAPVKFGDAGGQKCRASGAEPGGVEIVRYAFFAVLSLLCVWGCGPAASVTPHLEDVASVIQTFSSTATGLKASESTSALNGASTELATAQAQQISFEIQQQELQREQVNHERVVTARLLDQMASEYDEPILSKVAFWVAAGGDPDFAFKYALTQVGDKASKGASHQTLSIKTADRAEKAGPAHVEQPSAPIAVAPSSGTPAHHSKLHVPAAVPAGTASGVPTA